MSVLRIEPCSQAPGSEQAATALLDLIHRQWPNKTVSANALSELGSQPDTRAYVIETADDKTIAVAVATLAATVPGLPMLPDGTWLLDVAFVGDSGRNRSLISLVWTDVLEAMFADTDARLLGTFVDVSDRRLPQALEDVGFVWDEIFERPGRGRCWLMVANPPSRSTAKQGVVDIDELLSRH